MKIPPVRRAFIPRPGCVFTWHDYSQIEMKMFALLSQEKEMFHYIENKIDMHEATGRLMYGDALYNSDPTLYRQKTKALNFGIIYGMGIPALANALECSISKATKLRGEYLKRFPGIRRLFTIGLAKLKEQKYVEDMFGKRYHIKGQSYKLINYLTQGSSAFVLKYAMVQTSRAIKIAYANFDHFECSVLLPIHDEQFSEQNEETLEWFPWVIKYAMEDIVPVTRFGLKTEVDLEFSTKNWAAKEKYTGCKSGKRKAKKFWKEIRDEVVIKEPDKGFDWFVDAA